MIDGLSLPVGSCVKVKNQTKMIMIAGYIPYDSEKKEPYDYIGITTPIGIRKTRQSLVANKNYICFNDSDIEKIIFIGFSNDKSKFYRQYILNFKKNMKNIDGVLSKEMMQKILKDSLPNINNIKSEG